jgi:RHS repeat-associated protein
MDANGNVVWAHTNVWVGGALLATYDTNGIHFDLNDWNGSRRVQTDYEANVEQTCANLPYGNGEICTPTPSEFLYAGLQRDAESGLDHAMYRQYSSVFGQWTVPDPYGGSYHWANPQSLNRYGYAGNNPLALTDPSGLDPCPPDPSIVGYCVLIYGIGRASDLNSIVFTDSLSDFAGGITPLVGGAILFYDLGRAAGWWGNSPFHGNVAASQNGKSVPSMGSVNAPGPPAANSDPWDGHYELQALFQSPEAGEFHAAYTTVEWASAYDAIAAAPMALDAVASLPTMDIAVGTVDGNLHFAYGAEGAWYHVVGTGADAFQTSAYAAQFADSAYTFSVPVLSTEGIAPELGEGAANCFTAVCGAFLRGWWTW